MYFKNKNHEDLFNNLKHNSKRETAILYLMSSVFDNKEELNSIYDIDVINFGVEGYIKIENIDKMKNNENMTYKDKFLLALAFNLYNNIDITKDLEIGDSITPYSIYSTFYGSNKEYLKMYSTAMEMMI